MLVKAYVVLDARCGSATVEVDGRDCKTMSNKTIAPYKYPRAIEFVEQLPKTGTGKLQRFAPRQIAMASVGVGRHGR